MAPAESDIWFDWDKLPPVLALGSFCGEGHGTMIGHSVKFAASWDTWANDAGPCKPRQLKKWACEDARPIFAQATKLGYARAFYILT